MKKLKKLLITFLFSMPVFSEGREALASEETQLPVSAQTGSPSFFSQSLSVLVGDGIVGGGAAHGGDAVQSIVEIAGGAAGVCQSELAWGVVAAAAIHTEDN